MDDDGIYYDCDDSIVHDDATVRLANTIKELQDTYEAFKRTIDENYRISEKYRNDNVWVTMAELVEKHKANPRTWVKAQFDLSTGKNVFAANMAGTKALERYRDYTTLYVRKQSKQGSKEDKGEAKSSALFEIEDRIAAMRVYLKDRSGTSDPDSLMAMMYIDSGGWGIDALALLLTSSQKMYLRRFAHIAASELDKRVDLGTAARHDAKYKAKIKEIYGYVKGRKTR